ncbi:MAG: hypothetical protein DLM72_16960 [Candidatus Nitrosopolaris wilkensis]|nr:MAG: hypothetical protein DLM72_16960 [Candidatus Nitrosopolaris wilkensis]
MRTKTISSTAFAATLLVLAFAASGLVNPASAQQQKFTAKLSGNTEVPPVNTAGAGLASFQLSADGKSLNYQLNVTKMSSVMGAHIHNGKQGQNGPVVAGLFNPTMSGPATGAVNGQLSKGTITSTDLTGPLGGKQVSDLVNLLKSGGAYVNVHTTQNQNGEIRGQITSGTASSASTATATTAATTTTPPPSPSTSSTPKY